MSKWHISWLAVPQMNNEIPNGHWHLDKRVSVGHLVTTLTVAVAVVAWSFQIQNRITVTEVKLSKLEEAFVTMRADQGVQYEEIIRRLERLSDKLDKKTDK